MCSFLTDSGGVIWSKTRVFSLLRTQITLFALLALQIRPKRRNNVSGVRSHPLTSKKDANKRSTVRKRSGCASAPRHFHREASCSVKLPCSVKLSCSASSHKFASAVAPLFLFYWDRLLKELRKLLHIRKEPIGL